MSKAANKKVKSAPADKAKAPAKAKAKAKPAPAKGKAAKAEAPVAKGKAKVKAKATPVGKKGKDAAAVEEAVAKKKPAGPVKPGKGRPGGGALVVVESPAKAKTIEKYLGAGYTVKASVGHIMDLPKSTLGVDVEHEFEPEYVAIRGKQKVIADLKKTAKDVEIVYLAPDPDREGEAIAWHLAQEIKPANGNIKRVLFNEITKRGITDALTRPGDLDVHKFESQQTRRILDRLVGYQISPILWDKVRRGLSAGRVQSVAVRLIVEREREIGAFKPVEYWTIEADVEGGQPPQFRVKLQRVGGEKIEISTGAEAQALVDELQGSKFVIEKIEKKERRKFPLPPFITSRLQQEAARKLRFTAKKTMTLAQRLYEGLELGHEGRTGLITYMRTDSTRLSDDAVADARKYINERYGADSLPEEPVVYKTKKSAQDAHEAIRPTTTTYDPETVKRLLTEQAGGDEEKIRDAEDYIKLYTLIWNRFIACQMKPAVFDQTTVDVKAGREGRLGLRATGQVLKFQGYTVVYTESAEETGEQPEDAGGPLRLPELQEGETLTVHKIDPGQHFTQPPPRFTEASLVKELEERGIGRPSTYAAILSTIQDRGYCEKREGRFYPTILGVKVNDLLVESFPKILDATFTAQMEDDLDRVEEGSVDWHKLLGEFYGPFKEDLARAAVEMRDLKREETPTELVCEKCGSPMVIKWGRNGEFLACSGYPECKNTREFIRKADGSIEPVTPPVVEEKCPTCGSDMLLKKGRFGEFLACSKYPECKTTRPVSLGVTCPKPDCGGFLTEKRSKKGKVFYGCANYSKTGCDFVLWDKPVPKSCPQCQAKFLVKRPNRAGGGRYRCVNPDCGYTQDYGAQDTGEGAASAETETAEAEAAGAGDAA